LHIEKKEINTEAFGKSAIYADKKNQCIPVRLCRLPLNVSHFPGMLVIQENVAGKH